MTHLRRAAMAALLSALSLSGLVAEQEGGIPAPVADVGFDQRIGETVPGELPFLDADGNEVRLGDLLGQRPVILLPVYYRCPMLCPLTMEGLVQALRVLAFVPGADFDVVVFSIDPEDTSETASETRDKTLAELGQSADGVGWSFLVGSEESIRQLTAAIGFRYEYEPKSDQYFHAAGLVVLTPGGQVAQYFYGVEFSPKDLRLALVESSEGRLGSPIDQILLLCFHYDPTIGRYSMVALNSVRVGGTLTVLALAAFIGGALYRERRQRRRATGGDS